MAPRRVLIFAGLLFHLLIAGSLRAQDFVLENPADPMGASTATIVGTDLVITDAGGKEFVYVRRPDLDTKDGRYQAFFSPAANQYLQWPVIGAGSMLIGNRVRTKMVWTPSRMQIRSAAGGPVGPAPFIPGGPLHTGTLQVGPGRLCAAHIDNSGQLHFYLGANDRWQHLAGGHPPGELIPGAPVHLVPDPGAPLPRVFTIGARGRLLEIVSGQSIQELPAPDVVRFAPGSNFAISSSPTQTFLFATERHGRLWQIDLTGGKHELIEGHLGVLEPGLPMSVMRDGNELFMIDRTGALVNYYRDEKNLWQGPDILRKGFDSAGVVTTWVHPGTTDIEAAAVDRLGKINIIRLQGETWNEEPSPPATLPSGSPLTVFEMQGAVSITTVLPDGTWMELLHNGTDWQDRIIATGFPPGAPLGYHPYGPTLFAADITGRLVAAHWTRSEWHAVVCAPPDFEGDAIGFAPRLISRKTIAGRRIDPVEVELRNSTDEELIVRVLDSRLAGKVDEIVIPPRGAKVMRADRDVGGTLEEVYLVPGPNGPIERVRQFPLPPRQFYDLAVYANRVTYQYIDRRKQRGPLPDYSETSLVSIGTFPLPPGGLLNDGARLDVYEIATAHNNPGAAAILDPAAP